MSKETSIELNDSQLDQVAGGVKGSVAGVKSSVVKTDSTVTPVTDSSTLTIIGGPESAPTTGTDPVNTSGTGFTYSS